MMKTFFIHNLQINIFTNSRFILEIIADNLELIKSYPKPSNPIVINLHLQELDNYRQIPVSKVLDGFWAYPIYQQEYFEQDKLTMEVGPRTIKTVISPKENSVLVYITAPQAVEKDLLFDLIFFQPLTTLLKFHRLYLFHSSAVAKKNKCVLFTGDTGVGKSILALSLLKGGFSYLADDDIILQSEGSSVECLSFPTKIKIKQSLLKYFTEFKNIVEKSYDRKNKYKLNLEKIYPQITVNKSIPSLLIFPCYRKNSKIQLKPISKSKALSHLIKENYVLYKHKSYSYISKNHLKVLSNLAKQCQAFQLFYCDEELNDVPLLIERLLWRGK